MQFLGPKSVCFQMKSSVRCLAGTENDPHQDSSSPIKMLKVSGQAHEEVMEKKAKVKQNCPGDLMARDGGRHCGYRHRQTHLNPVYPRFIYNLTSHQLAVRPSHSVNVLTFSECPAREFSRRPDWTLQYHLRGPADREFSGALKLGAKNYRELVSFEPPYLSLSFSSFFLLVCPGDGHSTQAVAVAAWVLGQGGAVTIFSRKEQATRK